MKILFVCAGNTCRSPIAQGILQDLARKKTMGISVESAGIYAMDGQKASINAIRALELDNINIENHRASMVNEDIIRRADLVLTMGRGHKEILIDQYSFAKDKIYTLKEFAYNIEEDVVDPFGGDLDIYIRTKDEIYKAIVKLMERLEKGEY